MPKSELQKHTGCSIYVDLYEWAQANKVFISTVCNAALLLLKETGLKIRSRNHAKAMEALILAALKKLDLHVDEKILYEIMTKRKKLVIVDQETGDC